jgi:predicted transcriptional regulator
MKVKLMATEKENIIKMIKDLPNDISMEDIIEAIYVRQKIEKGLKDSEEGRLFTHEEAKERLAKWLK